MTFRYARHTNDLQPIIDFYTQVIGLEILGDFQSHDDYNGVFLGNIDLDWHLEFTESNETSDHHPDEDDLLVFYVAEEKLEELKERMAMHQIEKLHAKNPYWNRNGVVMKDPDGFGVVVAVER